MGAADANGDGELDAAELPGLFYPETNHAVLDLIIADTLKRKDKDHDGQLSVREFWRTPPEQEPSATELADFSKFDSDGSGTLSFDEIKVWESGVHELYNLMKTLFEVADKD